MLRMMIKSEITKISRYLSSLQLIVLYMGQSFVRISQYSKIDRRPMVPCILAKFQVDGKEVEVESARVHGHEEGMVDLIKVIF